MVTTINVKGMSCKHCVMAVTKVLNEIEGVKNVAVDLEKGKATFEHREGLDQNDLRTRIENAGYEIG
jgi:copper chaperone